mgnify:CR=1 FL=1
MSAFVRFSTVWKRIGECSDLEHSYIEYLFRIYLDIEHFLDLEYPAKRIHFTLII